MTKKTREHLEYLNLFTDERYAKKAWKQFMNDSLQSAAAVLPDAYDARGNMLQSSAVYNVAYKNVEDRLRARGIERSPMKAEVLVECNMIRASFDNAAFNTVLERTAGKVKEEVSIVTGAYEELTDEQLEVLQRHEEQKQLEAGENSEDK